MKKSEDKEEERSLLLSSSSHNHLSTKIEMTVSGKEPSRFKRIMKSVPSLGNFFRRRLPQKSGRHSRGMMSRSCSSSPTLVLRQSESRDNAVHEMVTSRKMYTSYFYRNAVMFFLSAFVLVCVELRDLYNLIGRARISTCCDDTDCTLQICADTGLFLCNQFEEPLTMNDNNVIWEFLRNTPWFYALSFMFVTMCTVIVILSIEAFHIQHYCYKLLSYRIYVDTFGHRTSKLGSFSLVMMIAVVELVYVILKANLVFVFNNATHHIERCGVEYDVVVGNSIRYDEDDNRDDGRFNRVLLSNFIAPFLLFLVVWRMILGQIFEMAQDPYTNLGLSNFFLGVKSDEPQKHFSRYTKISNHYLEILFRDFAQKHGRRSMTNAWMGCGPHVEFLKKERMDELVRYIKSEGLRRRFFRTLYSNRAADPNTGAPINSQLRHPLTGEPLASSTKSATDLFNHHVNMNENSAGETLSPLEHFSSFGPLWV